MAQPTRTPRRPPAGTPPEPGLEEARRSPWALVGRIVIVAMILGIAIMWIFALWGPVSSPGRLPDKTFPTAAESVCKNARDQMAQLPRAFQSPDATARADVIEQADRHLSTMVAELRTKVPAAQPQHDQINRWIDDWATYVSDREEYVAELRTNPSARFTVTQNQRDNKQITKAVDGFAQINNMPSCITPDDIS